VCVCVCVCVDAVCLVDQASCGCCLMQRKVQRMESFFNMTVEELREKLTHSKTALNDMRGEETADRGKRKQSDRLPDCVCQVSLSITKSALSIKCIIRIIYMEKPLH